MKKILLLITALSTILSATIANNKVYLTRSNIINPQGVPFEIKDPELGIGSMSVLCKGRVVYIGRGRTLAISYNPITREPYYCSLKKIYEDGLFKNSEPNFAIKIFYDYKNVDGNFSVGISEKIDK